MVEVKDGMYVQVHYVGSLDDGTVFDDSREGQPLEFQIGRQGVIPGFEQAVLEMALNEQKKITLSPMEAYGERQDNLLREFPITALGKNTVEPGQNLWFNSPRGPVTGMVVSLTPDNFTVDFNHPLAGKNLTFQLTLVGITDRPTQATCCSCGADPSSCGSGCSG
ncbi:FKBP-type peptidyl-prolyl cis-trans isomerase [Desulfobacca acetoxidans]|uniref:Peptidyl-prolyl cis-trans isomerase n=1 Tax=Desulfobacca acetoxidans (strain ATCC 700848 / DSM 11109 / ASRB2) TaxID=880072 RepID=F2NEV0_DESAR|nr:peptidylprolyl isomerase [Desulfobacca acetoxidans]AEB08290.1 peptidylprolyl isomerase FKBP-type [Desulfobacca acetoxidans DSM 11109]